MDHINTFWSLFAGAAWQLGNLFPIKNRLKPQSSLSALFSSALPHGTKTA
jgi:hypothetical protein